jgi:hypothetical protein
MIYETFSERNQRIANEGYVAAHALHLLAANIIFLIEAEKAMK